MIFLAQEVGQEDEELEYDRRIRHLEEQYKRLNIIGGVFFDCEGDIETGWACNKRRGEEVVAGGGFPTFGACCFDDGTCEVLTELGCTTGGGIYQGDGSVCEPNPCPQPTGACCVGTDCSIQTESDCTDMGGTYQGDDTTCDPNPCPATGACCIGIDCSIQTESDCTGAGGTYLGDGTVCGDITCACPCGFAAFDGSGRRFLTYNRTI